MRPQSYVLRTLLGGVGAVVVWAMPRCAWVLVVRAACPLASTLEEGRLELGVARCSGEKRRAWARALREKLPRSHAQCDTVGNSIDALPFERAFAVDQTHSRARETASRHRAFAATSTNAAKKNAPSIDALRDTA